MAIRPAVPVPIVEKSEPLDYPLKAGRLAQRLHLRHPQETPLDTDHAGQREVVERSMQALLLLVDTLALVWFSSFIGAAIVLRRRRPDAHKRLMMLASLAILYPAQARVGDMLGNGGLAIVGGTIALWLSLVIHDFISRKRLHVATAVGGFVLIIANPMLMSLLVGIMQRTRFIDTLACVATRCA